MNLPFHWTDFLFTLFIHVKSILWRENNLRIFSVFNYCTGQEQYPCFQGKKVSQKIVKVCFPAFKWETEFVDFTTNSSCGTNPVRICTNLLYFPTCEWLAELRRMRIWSNGRWQSYITCVKGGRILATAIMIVLLNRIT